MTTRELFLLCVESTEPRRTEILDAIEKLTQNYNPERVDALIADFEEMLSKWKEGEVCNAQAKLNDSWIKDAKRKYDELYTQYEEECARSVMALEFGINETLEYPEEPAPFIPPPPLPAPFGVSDVATPEMFNYAMNILESKRAAAPANFFERTDWLPSLDPIKAEKYFNRAIEAGYIEKKNAGLKWNKPIVQLAYFVTQIFKKGNDAKLHNAEYKYLATFFGVSDLRKAYNQHSEGQQTECVRIWKQEIDALFESKEN